MECTVCTKGVQFALAFLLDFGVVLARLGDLVPFRGDPNRLVGIGDTGMEAREARTEALAPCDRANILMTSMLAASICF